MKRKSDLFFCCFAILMLSLPMLMFFGIPEKFTKLAGVESESAVHGWTWTRWMERAFQKEAEEYYAKKFFLRKTFLKIRNQLYDLVNLGCFHSGYDGSIIEGRDHVLYERGYLDCYYAPMRVEESRHQASFRLIRQIFRKLRSRGIDCIYILAPDKVFLYPEFLPEYHKYYLRKQSDAPHEAYARLFAKYGIPHFNAYDFLGAHLDRGPFFPVAGTHWNAKGAALTVETVLTRLNAGKDAGKRYLIRTPDQFQEKLNRNNQYLDNDIGKLLNLYYSASLRRNIAYKPLYRDNGKPANPGTVIVFGDSFTGQPAQIFRDSRMFETVCNYLNRVPDRNELARDLKNARLFLLVQTTAKMFEPQFSETALRDFLQVLQSIPD